MADIPCTALFLQKIYFLFSWQRSEHKAYKVNSDSTLQELQLIRETQWTIPFTAMINRSWQAIICKSTKYCKGHVTAQTYEWVKNSVCLMHMDLDFTADGFLMCKLLMKYTRLYPGNSITDWSWKYGIYNTNNPSAAWECYSFMMSAFIYVSQAISPDMTSHVISGLKNITLVTVWTTIWMQIRCVKDEYSYILLVYLCQQHTVYMSCGVHN